MFELELCHDIAALYLVYDLKNNELTNQYRVYYTLDVISDHRDFDSRDEAEEFLNLYTDQNTELIFSETDSMLKVLALTK